MPEGRVNSGDFREGTPITAGHTFGTPVTVPPNDGNIEPQSNSTLDSNPITWVPSPAQFGNGTGFSMQATPPVVNIARGQFPTVTTTVTITSLNAAPATVTLTYSGAPVGVSIAFGTNPTTGTSVATLTVGAGVTQGKYTITIVGTATPEVENTNIHLVVF